MHTRLTGWLYRHDALYKSSLRHFHSHCNVGTPLHWHGFKLTLGIAKEVTTLSWYVTHNNDVSQCNYTDTARQFCTAGRHKRKNADIMCAISPHCVDVCVRYQVSSVFSFLITLDWPPFSSSSSCKFTKKRPSTPFEESWGADEHLVNMNLFSVLMFSEKYQYFLPMCW